MLPSLECINIVFTIYKVISHTFKIKGPYQDLECKNLTFQNHTIKRFDMSRFLCAPKIKTQPIVFKIFLQCHNFNIK